MFTVTVIQHDVGSISDSTNAVERYKQTVDEFDIRAVMAAVNQRPRKPRERKPTYVTKPA